MSYYITNNVFNYLITFYIYTQAANKSQSGGDKSLIEAYKKLQELRSNFEKLFTAIDRMLQNEKLSHDLETKIDQERTRVSTNNIAQISVDIAAVKGENAALIEQIKKVSVAAK